MSNSTTKNTISIISLLTLIGLIVAILNDGTGFYEWVKNKIKTEEKYEDKPTAPPSREINVQDEGTYIEGNQTIIYRKENNTNEESSIKPMELIDVIDLFTEENNVNYCLPWDVGSDYGTDIDWLHEGILWDSDVEKDAKHYNLRGYYRTCDSPSARAGRLQIFVNGKPTHTILKKKKEPADWFIHLCGARVGVLDVKITTHTGNHDFCGFINYFKSKGVFIDNPLKTYTKDHKGVYQDFYTEYEIMINNKKVQVIEQDSNGNGKMGCFPEIYFTTNYNHKFRFPDDLM